MRTVVVTQMIGLAVLVLVCATSCRRPTDAQRVRPADAQRVETADEQRAGIITTVAGDGWMNELRDGRYSGDGGPATKASLSGPTDLAVGKDDSIYIADPGNSRVRKVSPAGAITTVAGNGKFGFSGDGGPAVRAALNSPTAIALGPDGNLYIADIGNHRIRKVDREGIITTVAGSGPAGEHGGGHSGDGGLATKALLYLPTAVAIGPEGTPYLADGLGSSVRKVGRNGIITTVVGSWLTGYAGDGGPAAKAKLDGIRSIAVGADGSLYIADSQNQRIREVDPGGIITTIAGDGWKGKKNAGRFAGDGGPATEASFDHPRGVALGPDGSLYIADTYNHRIRKVDPNGIITTVAGDGWAENGEGRFAGDDGLATEASLFWPGGLALGADGSLYIADNMNHRIRKVTPR